MKALFLTFAAVTASFVAMAQNETKVIAGKYNEYAVSYLLPKTVVDVEIIAEQSVAKAGPYANYSQKYLGIPANVTKDKESWKLVSATASARGVPDAETYYNVQLKGGASPYVYLDKDGVLLSVNAEPKVDAAALRPASTGKTASPLDDNSYSLALTEEMLLSGSNVKMAELAAKQIYRLRESRTDLITGDSDQKPDGEALKIMLNQIDEQEKRLTAMFTGTVQTRREVSHVTWIPESESDNVVVARISEKDGVVAKDDLSGTPLYISLGSVVRGEEPIDAKGNLLPMPKNAVMYNIPGEASVTLSYGGRDLSSSKLNLTQFGVKFGLNQSLFTDKKAPTYLILYPQTGGIKEIGQNVKEQ